MAMKALYPKKAMCLMDGLVSPQARQDETGQARRKFFLLQNKANGIFGRYFAGVMECWNNAAPFEQWILKHPNYE